MFNIFNEIFREWINRNPNRHKLDRMFSKYKWWRDYNHAYWIEMEIQTKEEFKSGAPGSAVRFIRGNKRLANYFAALK